MKLHTLSLLLAAGALGFACGPQQDPTQLGPDHAATAGSGLAATTEGTVAFFEFNPMQVPQPLAAQSSARRAGTAEFLLGRLTTTGAVASAADCRTFEGDLSDPDVDGIPLAISVTYDCHFQDGDETASLTGVESLRDTQPDVAAFALEARKDHLLLTVDTPEESASILHNAAVIANEDGSLYELAVQDAVAATVTGTNGAHAFAASEDVAVSLDTATRDVTINGSWAVSADGGHAAATLQTAPSVHYNPMCATEAKIDGGAIEATWSNGVDTVTLRVEWEGCGQAVIYFNGELVENNS